MENSVSNKLLKTLENLNVKEETRSGCNKKWQETLSSNQREKYKKKLSEILLNSKLFSNQSTDNLASDIEENFFNLAENRAEYYHMIAEKIYSIQKECENNS
nr:histone acetyltransferase p300-like [Onthophagus taurus]